MDIYDARSIADRMACGDIAPESDLREALKSLNAPHYCADNETRQEDSLSAWAIEQSLATKAT